MNRFFCAVVVPVAAGAVAGALALTFCLIPASVPAQTHLFLYRWQSHCAPEPREQVCYLLAITIVPLVFWLGAIYDRRWSGATEAANPAAYGAWPATVRWIFAILVLGILLYQEIRLEPYVGVQALAAAFVLVLLISLTYGPMVRAWKKGRQRLPGADSRRGLTCRWRRHLPFLLALVLTVLELLPSVYLRNMREVGLFYQGHTPVQLGEFAAVLAGRTPFVDFTPQYQVGLSYALAPFFQQTGLTIGTFSVAMCLLSLLGLLVIYFVFARVTKSACQALLLYLPFLFVSFTPHSAAGIPFHQRSDSFNYYAVWPMRYFGPAITAGVLTWYLASPGGIRRLVLFFAAGLAALNNLDFGLPALGAVLIAVLLTDGAGSIPHWRIIVRVLTSLALGVGLAVLGFLLLTYGRTGVLPHLGMLTFYQRVFVLNGFNMLPMPALGLHVVFYLTFMGAIARGLFGDPERRLVNGLLLYFGVFGSGALMYYVGRSHHVVLITVFSAWACAFVLLAYVLAGELFGRSAPASFLQGLHPRGLLFGLGLLLCIWQVKAFPNPVHQIARLRMRGGAPWPNIDPMMQFVRDHARARERVIIIFPYGHLIAYQANVINVFPFVQGESLILRCQVDQVMETIKRSEIVRVFGSFEPELAEALARFGFQPTGRVEGGFELWEPRKGYGM